MNKIIKYKCPIAFLKVCTVAGSGFETLQHESLVIISMYSKVVTVLRARVNSPSFDNFFEILEFIFGITDPKLAKGRFTKKH